MTDSLALQLVGLGPGTPVTEAILSILSVRTGTSRDAIRDRGLLLLQAGENARCRKIITDLLANLHQLEAGTVDEGSNDSSEKTCTEIQADDLESGRATGEPTATAGKTVTPGEDLSAAECDASNLISVSGTVEWTLLGVLDKKCHEPLIFTLKGNTTEDIIVYVHKIEQGANDYDGWVEVQLGPQNTMGGGEIDVWWSSDDSIQYPEFVAVFSTVPKYDGCQWVGDDPAVAGVKVVPIQSSCP